MSVINMKKIIIYAKVFRHGPFDILGGGGLGIFSKKISLLWFWLKKIILLNGTMKKIICLQ